VANLRSGALLSTAASDARAVDPPGLDRSWRDSQLVHQWAVAASPGAVKLLVRQDGMYRVAADRLFAAGLPVGTALSSLQLWAGGRAIAFRALSADGKTLQAGDALEFFGQAADTRYTDARVYWVTPGLGTPLTIAQAPATEAISSPTSFRESLEVRDHTLHISALINPDTDGFFGPAIIGNRPLTRVFSTPALDVLASDAAVLEVSVQGLTNGWHTLDVQVNGTTVGSVQGNFQDVASASFTLPPGVLVAGDNTVALIGRTSTEIAVELSQRLTYPRRYVLEGPLRFTAPAGAQLQLTGLDAATAHVLDITSAVNPSVVSVASSPDGLVLTAPGTGSRILYAYRDQALFEPTVVPNTPSSWNAAQGADLVIIGPGTLLPSLQPLADQRIREGLSVAVVDVEDVYDEFSAGEKDAAALGSFLDHALRTWSTPPRYVLLAGAATYDPRGWLGHPELDQVPTMRIVTRYLETASDDALVTAAQRGLPALAVGRLPFSQPAQMDAAVAKILGRRLGDASESVLLVHDRDGTIPFSTASAEVRAALPGWNATDLARGPDDAATHDALVAALRDSPVAVDYQGHGAEDLWGGRILSTSDVDALTGSHGTTLLVASTCLNAYFLDIGRESLGAALLRTPEGGAWGVWASSGMTLPTEHAALSSALLSAALLEGTTLGEATLRAKQTVSDPDLRSTFVLLGDPSSRAVVTGASALTASAPRAGAGGCGSPGGPLAALVPLVLLALMLSPRRRRPSG
jgi:hypothetical protein